MPQGSDQAPQVQTVQPGEAETPTSVGFSVTLAKERVQAAVDKAVKAEALEVAREKKITIPTDETEFRLRAKVHWRADGSAAVTLEV